MAVRPDFDQKFADTTVTEGEEVKMTVKVSGTPIPDVEWQKGGKPIRDGRRVKIDKNKDGVHELRIPRVETADQGEYSCVAKNKAGKATCSAKLAVEGNFGFVVDMLFIQCTMKCKINLPFRFCLELVR